MPAASSNLRRAALRDANIRGRQGKRWDHTARPASYDKKVGSVLQGGGALGSYQGGVYEALVVSEYLPDWVAGIAIGAINAAVIAGNAPEHRVQRLRSFWEEITARTSLWHSAPDGPIVERQQWAGALTALMFGQPVFFEPREPHVLIFIK